MKNFRSPCKYWLDWSFRDKIVSSLLSVILCTSAALMIVNYIAEEPIQRASRRQQRSS